MVCDANHVPGISYHSSRLCVESQGAPTTTKLCLLSLQQQSCKRACESGLRSATSRAVGEQTQMCSKRPRLTQQAPNASKPAPEAWNDKHDIHRHHRRSFYRCYPHAMLTLASCSKPASTAWGTARHLVTENILLQFPSTMMHHFARRCTSYSPVCCATTAVLQ